MPSNFLLTLDTLGPQGVAATLDGGAAYTNTPSVTLTTTTSDPDITGYQMKIWGDIEGGPIPEASAVWTTYASASAITLSSGDALKTVNVRLRDDVWNESGIASAAITLDTTAPTVSITSGPDRTRVSRIVDRRQSTFTWSADENIDRYEVRVVPAATSLHTEGTLLTNTSGGSSNLSADGAIAGGSAMTTVIDGRDLPDPDGDKRVKVFVRDTSGKWST